LLGLHADDWSPVAQRAARHVSGGVNVLDYGLALNGLIMRPHADLAAKPAPLPGFLCSDSATAIYLQLPPSDGTVAFDLRGIEGPRTHDAHVKIDLPPVPGHWHLHLPMGLHIKVRSNDAISPERQRVTVSAWHRGAVLKSGELRVGTTTVVDMPPIEIPPAPEFRL
jgi:hypothetical protein